MELFLPLYPLKIIRLIEDRLPKGLTWNSVENAVIGTFLDGAVDKLLMLSADKPVSDEIVVLSSKLC